LLSTLRITDENPVTCLRLPGEVEVVVGSG
jgi:hypothetical protein